jgi:hypothetical protein
MEWLAAEVVAQSAAASPFVSEPAAKRSFMPVEHCKRVRSDSQNAIGEKKLLANLGTAKILAVAQRCTLGPAAH